MTNEELHSLYEEADRLGSEAIDEAIEEYRDKMTSSLPESLETVATATPEGRELGEEELSRPSSPQDIAQTLPTSIADFPRGNGGE